MSRLKVIVCGAEAVGKTRLVSVLAEIPFLDWPTLSFERHVVYFQNKTLELWDVSGSEEKEATVRGCFCYSDCAIIMFDMSREETFTKVSSYISAINAICGNIPIVIVGNKKELVSDETRKAYRECLYGLPKNIIDYIEMSIENFENVYLPFDIF